VRFIVGIGKVFLLLIVLGALRAAQQGDSMALVFLAAVFLIYAKRDWIAARIVRR
jgi:hypothetical protein